MTYLDLVNQVLLRLRDDKIGAFTDDVYVETIKTLVNDAKFFVENSWEWNINRHVDKFIANKNAVTLPNSNLTGYRLYNVRDTNGRRLRLIPKGYALDKVKASPSEKPWGYYHAGRNQTEQAVGIFPPPVNNPVFEAEAYYPSPPLVAEGDVLYIPALPVIMYATAFAVRERGETGGTSSQEWTAFAQQALKDAISKDTLWNPDEFTWQEV